MDSKRFYQSKTLWVNFFALVATLAQAKWGMVISPEYQGYALVAVNLLLRAVTNKGLEA